MTYVVKFVRGTRIRFDCSQKSIGVQLRPFKNVNGECYIVILKNASVSFFSIYFRRKRMENVNKESTSESYLRSSKTSSGSKLDFVVSIIV